MPDAYTKAKKRLGTVGGKVRKGLKKAGATPALPTHEVDHEPFLTVNMDTLGLGNVMPRLQQAATRLGGVFGLGDSPPTPNTYYGARRKRPDGYVNRLIEPNTYYGARRKQRPSGIAEAFAPPGTFEPEREHSFGSARSPQQIDQISQLLGLSQDLGEIGQGPRPATASPMASLLAGGPAATAASPVAALLGDPVRAQRHRPPGRYTRPTPGLGGGPPPLTANDRLAQAMQADNVPRSPVTSKLTGENVGRFSAAFVPEQGAGDPIGQYAQAMGQYRDALAGGEEAVYPGSFRGAQSPGTPEEQLAAQGVQDTLKDRRQKRREREGIGAENQYVPKDIRQRLVTAKKQGRQITPSQAMVEKKIDEGKPLTPVEAMIVGGPEVGVARMEFDAQAKEAELAAGVEDRRSAAGIYSAVIGAGGSVRDAAKAVAALGGKFGEMFGGGGEPSKLSTATVKEMAKEATDREDLRDQMEENNAPPEQIDKAVRKHFPPTLAEKGDRAQRDLAGKFAELFEKHILPVDRPPVGEIPAKALDDLRRKAKAGDAEAKALLAQIQRDMDDRVDYRYGVGQYAR